MKAFKTFLVITATMIVAVAVPLAQASNPSPAQLRGIEIRGQAMNTLCQSPTLSREAYVALCGTKGARHQPTAAELRAYEIRGQAMNAMHQPSVSGSTAAALRALQIRGQGMDDLSKSPTLSREAYVALFGTKGAQHQPTAAVLRAYAIRGRAMNAMHQPSVSGSTAAALHALQIRGQGMDDLAKSPTLSREAYVALFGTKGSEHQPTAAELRAFAIRGQGMDDLSESPTLSREAYVALFGTRGSEHQPTVAALRGLEIRGQAMNSFAAEPTASAAPSTGFNWNYFGIGAAAILGAVLLTGGIWAGLHFSRKPSAPPHTVS